VNWRKKEDIKERRSKRKERKEFGKNPVVLNDHSLAFVLKKKVKKKKKQT
jgi:hypothetical protein